MNEKIIKNIENLIKANELFKKQLNLTDDEVLITPKDFQDPSNPYPDMVTFNGYTYLKDPSDFANDLCIYSINIDPNYMYNATHQIACFECWLANIYSEAHPILQAIKPASYDNNTYLIIASQFC